jgi:hypothetical protein
MCLGSMSPLSRCVTQPERDETPDRRIGVNGLAWMMSLAAVQISQIGAAVGSPGGSWWPAAIVGGSAQIWDSAGGEQHSRLGETGTVPGQQPHLTAAGRPGSQSRQRQEGGE